MVTIRTGRYSPKKAVKKASSASFTHVPDDSQITWLEKGGQTGGATTKELIEDALDEYARLFKAGIASNAEKLTLARAFPDAPSYVAAAADIPESSVMVVGGPASVEMIDREGHLIKADALDRAFKKYMENFRTRNAMVLHSDVQVGWALPAYITKGGQIYKSGVNDKELFFICELRDDTRIAERVAKQIEDGKLRSYSIAGSATKVQNMQKGVMPYMQVEDMELAEVTVCEKGVNQGAAFQILKAQTGKISKDQCGFRPATEVEIENGIMCGTCKFFNKEDKTCDTVDGVFDDTDYCKIFDAEEAQPEMEEGPKVKVRLILSDDNNIEFNKTLQELVQNPEWSTTSAGLQTQRDFWDWDLEKDWNPFKKDPTKEAAKRMWEKPGTFREDKGAKRAMKELGKQGMKNFEHFISMYPDADDEVHLQAWMDRPDAYHAYYENKVGKPNYDYINEQSANIKAGKGIILPSGQSLFDKPKQTQQEPEIQKDWNPFKSDAQRSKEMGEKLDRLREENPKFFAEQDRKHEESRANIMQELKDRAAAKAATSAFTPEQMEKQANTDRARVYADPKQTMMDEADRERATKPKMYRSTAKGIQEKIQALLASDTETLGEKQQSIDLKEWGDRQTKSYLERARDMARERRPKVDKKDPATLPVVSEVREEMENLPATINRGDKGDTKMEKSLTNRLIDLYKAAGDISFTTPSKGRGNAGMGGGTVTPAMGNPELELADDSMEKESLRPDFKDTISPELAAQNEHRASEAKKPMSEQRDQEGNLLSEVHGPGTKYDDGRISFLEGRINRSKPDHPMYEPLSDEDKKLASQRNMIRRGEMDIDTSDRGVRGNKARLQGLSPKTGRPEKQPGYSPPVDALGQSYDTSSMSTGNWDWQAPDTPAEQKWKADKYQEQLSSRGGGPSGIGSGEGSDHIDNPYNRYGGENFPGQKVDPANVPNTRTESMQRLLDAYKKKPMPKPDMRMPERAAREGMSRQQSEGMDIRASMDQEKSITKRLLKLYKANDDPMTTKESFTALTNEEARQKEHDQLLREYGFPSEVDPEANRYVPVIETETDDKGIPINTKGPWVVNEAGNDIGESHDEDAPSFSTSEKARNREGKKTASVSKSYLEKPPVTPFISKRSL